MSNALYEREHSAIGAFPYARLINQSINNTAHYHEEVEIIYVEQGNIKAITGMGELQLDENDICIFMPGEIHSYRSLQYNNVYVLKLSSRSYVEQIDFERIRLHKNKLSPSDPIYSRFLHMIRELFDEYTNKEKGYEFAVRHCSNQIIFSILRYLPHEVIEHRQNNQMLNIVNDYLSNHYHEKISLDQLANICHFSKYYFAHKIKELSGMTYIEYLTAFRLDKATELLATPSTKIIDIAHQCGFGELRSFHRAFQSLYHMKPSEFRKNIMEGKRAEEEHMKKTKNT